MDDVLGVMRSDGNVLRRPVRLVICDTGVSSLVVPASLRPKLEYIPWTDASAYQGEPIVHSHGSFVKMIACEFFRCRIKRDDVEVHGYQCLDSSGNGSADAIAAALLYAIQVKADVVNLSLGAHFSTPYEEAALRRAMKVVNEAGRELYDQGALIFVAAGNDDEAGDWTGDDIDFPAIYDWAIAVGSLTDDGRKSNFSGDGAKLEFVADGENYYGMKEMDGTSFATPLVAGFAAYLKTYVYGDINARDIRCDLRRYCVHGGRHEHGAWCRDHGYGSLTPYARLVLDHVAELRKQAGEPDDGGMGLFA